MNISNRSNLRFEILLPLWGRSYARSFLDLVVPSLLMSENLPALSAGADSVFKLICPFEDAEVLATSEQVRALKSVLPVEFVIQTPVKFDGYSSSYHRYSGYYNRVLGDPSVSIGNTVFVFLTPDGIYGNGSLARARALCEQRYSAVLIPGPRVVKETFLPEYQAILDSSGGKPNISNRALVQMFFRHVHRITKSFLANAEEGYFNTHPAHLYWRIDGEGFVYRSFVCHPLMFRPEREFPNIEATLDHALVPQAVSSLDSVYVCTDSDDIFGVDIAPESYDQNAISYKRHSEREVRRTIHEWLNRGWATPYHIWQASHEGRIHNGSCGPGWKTASMSSQALYEEVLRAEGIQSVQQLKTLPHGKMCNEWPGLKTGVPTKHGIRHQLRNWLPFRRGIRTRIKHRLRRTLPVRLMYAVLRGQDKQFEAAIRTINVALAARIEANNEELGRMLSRGVSEGVQGRAAVVEAQEILAYTQSFLDAQHISYRKQLTWLGTAVVVLALAAIALGISLLRSVSS